MDIDFSFSALMAGLIFGIIGFYLMKDGWRRSNNWHLLLGLILCVYPYFVSGGLKMWLIGVVCLGLAYMKRA